VTLELATKSSDVVYLENSQLRIAVGKKEPAIHEYLHKPSGGKLFGEVYAPRRSSVGLTVCKQSDPVPVNLLEVTYKPKVAKDMVNYRATVTHKGDKVVEFDLAFALRDNGLSIKFGNVAEHGDFHLISVSMPNLVTVKADGKVAKLGFPAEAGRLVDVATAPSRSVKFKVDWLNPLLAEFVYNDRVVGVLETDSVENQMGNAIYGSEEERCCSLSLDFVHRLREYDLVEYGHLIPARDPKYHLLVQESSEATVSVIGDYDGDGEVSWVDAAKFIRDKIDTSVNPLYADKLVYKIFLDEPGQRDITTFPEALELFTKIAHLTDYAPQIVYLVGWQYTGHDTGYPSVDKVNERLGGYDSLIRLMKEAEKLNVVVSFHDNYDDTYVNNPGWDPETVSRDTLGNLMEAGVWNSGQCYLISSYKYAVKSGLERVRDTLRRYPIKTSYHIDVLSGAFKGGRRYDFNPESPSAAKRNLEGKFMIIDEFARHGVDVTTEDFSSLFVGKVSWFLNLCVRDNVYYRNEDEIPLIPFIYHSKACFGGISGEGKTGIMKSLLYGASSFRSLRAPFRSMRSITDRFYLVVLPWNKLYSKKMDSYVKRGTVERVTYEDGSYVEIDHETKKYVVQVNGEVISKDFTCFVPKGDNVYFGYSKDGGPFSYPVPKRWKKTLDVKVEKLGEDGKTEPTDLQLENGLLSFAAEPGAPYKITFEPE
jgi:hypothetical protein